MVPRNLLILALVLALAGGLSPWASSAQAGPAYEKAGKYDDLPTYEGKVLSVNHDAGRLTLRGEHGARTFEASPGKIAKLEKGQPVRVTYEQDGSGRRAVIVVPLVIPEGVTPAKDAAAVKQKLIEAGGAPDGD